MVMPSALAVFEFELDRLLNGGAANTAGMRCLAAARSRSPSQNASWNGRTAAWEAIQTTPTRGIRVGCWARA